MVSVDGIRPAPQILDAIRKFPRPTNISRIRAWFGLVEQVSYAFSKTNGMLPFFHLLAYNAKFVWKDGLQSFFDSAHQVIGDKVSEGVKTFVFGHQTTLVSLPPIAPRQWGGGLNSDNVTKTCVDILITLA